MVKEQHKKVLTARATADAAVLHQASFVFLGTVTAPTADAGAPTVVSAGLFYPRSCSKDGAEMPHMYVELLCCNSPGRGYGSILLSHIEQFTAAGADYLSAAFTGCMPAGADAAKPMQSSCAGGSAQLQTAAAVAGSGAAGASALLPMPVVLPLVAEGVPIPADPLSTCCTACGSAADAGASSASSASMQLSTPAEMSCATSVETASTVPAFCTHQQQEQLQLLPVAPTASMLGAAAAGAGSISTSPPAAVTSAAAPVAAAAVSMTKRIRGVKLLSVESARSFYERHGYGQPDACKELFKPLLLLLLQSRDAAGSASSSSICSMMSVSSSSSNAVC
jgi:hypothetical protein